MLIQLKAVLVIIRYIDVDSVNGEYSVCLINKYIIV